MDCKWPTVVIENNHYELLTTLHSDINNRLNSNYTTFKIIEARRQLVAGFNYQFILEADNNKI
jgi:hypothetical protein